MRDRRLSIQEAVLGDPLEDIRRSRRSGGGGWVGDGSGRRSADARAIRAYVGNVRRVPQSVVKRIRAGGCHSPKELRRQLAYVTREEAAHATWTNLVGVDRPVGAKTLERVVEDWSSSWRGAPKRGHTDHIILSFPSGVTLEQAEAIARAWGQAIFASGDYGDQWRYVAAVHADPDHIHAHFVVDKVGCDWGQFLSINARAELNYDVMRERHAEISNAYGVEMVASSRLSRGIVANPPRETDYRAAHALHGRGCEVEAPPMSVPERVKREALVRGFAEQYAGLGRLAGMVGAGDAFMEKLAGAFFRSAETLEEGEVLVTEAEMVMKPGADDPVARLVAAREDLLGEAREAWDNIQAVEAGPERVQLEAEFSKASAESLEISPDETFFRDHSVMADAGSDLFANLTLASMNHVREGLGEDDPHAVQIDGFLEEVRGRLESAFTVHEDRLAVAHTTPEELVEYALQGEHSVAQVAVWNERGAGGLAAEAGEAQRMVADVGVPRNLQEAVALDQLLSVDRGHLLSDVPAIEALVDRMEQELDRDEVARVLTGDDTPLQTGIGDPAVRAAVAAEMRNEADIGAGVPDGSPAGGGEGETVEAYQEMARAQVAELERGADRTRDAGADLDDDHSL